jgi:hypothetical protein
MSFANFVQEVKFGRPLAALIAINSICIHPSFFNKVMLLLFDFFIFFSASSMAYLVAFIVSGISKTDDG